MNAVGILLLGSFLVPSFEGRAQSSDQVQTPWAAMMAVSNPSHSSRFRKPVNRRPHKAQSEVGLGPVLDNQKEDPDAGDYDELDALVASPAVVNASEWVTFALSRTGAVWASCHRIPLRC